MIEVLFNVVQNAKEHSISNMIGRIKERTGKYVLFVIDEAHLFSSVYPGLMERLNGKKESLLTAITREASIVPILCCSTMITGVNLALDIYGQVSSYILQLTLPLPYDLSLTLPSPNKATKPAEFMVNFLKLVDPTGFDREAVNNLLYNSPTRFCTMLIDKYFLVAMEYLGKELPFKEILLRQAIKIYSLPDSLQITVKSYNLMK